MSLKAEIVSQVVHGDIKLDNIVITKDLKNVAICDFGTAGKNVSCNICVELGVIGMGQTCI